MRTNSRKPKFILLLTLFLLLNNVSIACKSVDCDYHAIIIAIDEYETDIWSPLENTVKDGKALKNVLESKYGFSSVTTIYNKSATRSNIISTIEKQVNQLDENDNLLIYFSGYTMAYGLETYWIPVDANADKIFELVPTSSIKNTFFTGKPEHILVLVDGLFSKRLLKSVNVPMQNDGSDIYYNKMSELISRQMIFSGSDKPIIKEGEEHSVFMKYLLKYLNKNEKKVFEANELFAYLKQPVTSNSPNSPEFGYIQNTGHEGGQFLFQLVESKDKETRLCDSPVYFEEGENIRFDENGGVLNINADFKNVKYEWFFNSKPINHNEASLKVTESGVYGVTIIMNNGECTKSTISKVEVLIPKVTIDILQGENVVFKEKGTLNVAIAGYRDGFTYEWRKGDFIVGNKQSLEVTESDNYTIIIKDSDGQELGRQQTNVKIEYKSYIVQSGDNVKRIAQQFYNDENAVDLIYDANPDIEKGTLLKVGSKIAIPSRKQVTKEKSSLSVGTTSTFAPFAATDAYNGGMLTDIVENVYKKMDKQIDIQFLTGSSLKDVYSGSMDLGFPFTKNKNDNIRFLYSDPIYTTATVFFGNITSEINDVDEVMDKRMKKRKYEKLIVAVPTNFMCDKLLDYTTEGYILTESYSTTKACFEAMKSGEVDLVAVPQIVGLVAIQNASEMARLDFKILQKPVESTTLHIVISKEHPDGKEIMDDFNSAFAKAKEEGTIDKIIKTHISLIQKNRQ
ncbi:MAG: caspase family protein [Saprospiraceae bacterium]